MEQKTTLTERLGYYIAPKTYAQLSNAMSKVKKQNLDRFYIVDGREGEAGKSTLAMQLAYSIDPTLEIDNIVFSSKEFETRIRELGKYKALIFDEAFRGLSSKGALSKLNKKLISLIQECRQRNLFVFVVLPSIFLLEKYVAIFRSQALFHAYNPNTNENRRYYKIYNYSNKRLLYIYGKTLMTYNRPRIGRSYRFYSKFPPTINRKEYEKKKSLAFTEHEIELTPRQAKVMTQRTAFSYLLKKKYSLPYSKQAKYLESVDCGCADTILSRQTPKIAEKIRNTGFII